MRKESLIAAALLVACAAPVHAATGTSFGMQVGYAMPEGPFKDMGQNGLVIETTIQHMATPAFGFGASAAFTDWHGTDATNAQAEAVFGTGTTAVFTNWAYTGYAIAALPIGAVSPYVRAGAGLFNPKVQVRTPTVMLDDTGEQWGYLAGAGFTTRITPRMDMGIDGTWQQYHDSASDKQISWVNVKLNVMFALPSLGTGFGN